MHSNKIGTYPFLPVTGEVKQASVCHGIVFSSVMGVNGKHDMVGIS